VDFDPLICRAMIKYDAPKIECENKTSWRN